MSSWIITLPQHWLYLLLFFFFTPLIQKRLRVRACECVGWSAGTLWGVQGRLFIQSACVCVRARIGAEITSSRQRSRELQPAKEVHSLLKCTQSYVNMATAAGSQKHKQRQITRLTAFSWFCVEYNCESSVVALQRPRLTAVHLLFSSDCQSRFLASFVYGTFLLHLASPVLLLEI